MAGYIHTCANCGAHMQVHERYLGRNLRCTSCRTEFLAAIPDDVDIVEPPPEISDEDLPQREKRRWMPWLLLLLPIAAFVWWLGQDMSGGAAGGLFKRGTGQIPRAQPNRRRVSGPVGQGRLLRDRPGNQRSCSCRPQWRVRGAGPDRQRAVGEQDRVGPEGVAAVER